MACVAYSFHARIISLNCREWNGARGRAGERHARGEPGVLLSFGRTGLVTLVLCLVMHSQRSRVHRGRGGPPLWQTHGAPAAVLFFCSALLLL